MISCKRIGSLDSLVYYVTVTTHGSYVLNISKQNYNYIDLQLNEIIGYINQISEYLNNKVGICLPIGKKITLTFQERDVKMRRAHHEHCKKIDNIYDLWDFGDKMRVSASIIKDQMVIMTILGFMFKWYDYKHICLDII